MLLLAAAVLANVVYGPHARNVLDFYRAPSDTPTPLAVFIHGGDFTSGGKSQLDAALRDRLLDAGISVAAINYRYASPTPSPAPRVPAPMLDAARAIQFLRSQSHAWNIDPRRIAAVGDTAGGAIALWIGYHDDLAHPASTDPIERESSRLQAIAVRGAQTTFDTAAISEFLSPATARNPSAAALIGVAPAELDTPRARALLRTASPATQLSKGDPPTWLYYDEPNVRIPPNARPGTGADHPNFGFYLRERCASLGVVCELRLATDYQDIRGAANEEFAFLRDKLRAAPDTLKP